MAWANSLTIYKGEDVTLTYVIVQATSTGTKIDVNGWTTTWTLKSTESDPSALVTKSGSIVAPSSCGNIAVSLNSSDTLLLAANLYVADLWRVDVGSNAALAIDTVKLHWSVLRP